MFHLAAPVKLNPADLYLQMDAHLPARPVSNTSDLPIMETPVRGFTRPHAVLFDAAQAG
ncbi:MAG: hypothetical protein MRJ67_03700 [Nitrospirales bacterium]|nr:hypothetical protein [Nitrospirales bacterium]